MNLDLLLKDLRGVKGYIASGIATPTGEAIAGDSMDPTLDVGSAVALTNDVMSHAHDVAQRYAGTHCDETLIRSTNIIVMIRATGPNSRVPLHIGCVLEADGNIALARMTMEKIAEKAVAAF